MNDPGLDEPIANDAKDVENQERDEREEREEDEQAFLEPDRWWMAGTAFPLVAGTFGPMASAFSICALVVHWREYIPPGATEEDAILIPDPTWLIGINAAQLAIALISNLFLLLNMARRVRFSIAQPITIIGWYISSFVLIGLCACAAGPLAIQPKADHAFSQAFYYAIFAAGLYFMVASLMMVTVWGAYRGHYEKEFQLTMSQRTLMLQTISYFVYLLSGAAVYSHIEGWLYLDAVYFADVTLLTVGLGDYSPSTHLGRGLLFPFAIFGIIILGLVIGSIRSLVLERGKVKMGARMVEKQRRRLLKKVEKSDTSSFLKPIEQDGGTISRTSTQTLQTINRMQMTERQRREKEFDLMRKIQEEAHARRRWTSLIISMCVWFFLWFVGAAIFEVTETDQGWTYFVSLYFSYTSLLTIGYGDIYPKSNSGKAFFVFWSLLAVPSLTILISNMGDTVVKGVRDLTLWLGKLSVLPGEQGVKPSLREAANKLTRGHMFDSHTHEMPPGILGETKRKNDSDNDSNDGNQRHNDPDSAAQRHASDNAMLETARAKKQAELNDELPKSRRHYHYILIREIGKVQKHLKSAPPRKYTFDEWAWYLKLIGEDESDSSTHRKALRKPKPDGEGLGCALDDLDRDRDRETDHGEGNGTGQARGRSGWDGDGWRRSEDAQGRRSGSAVGGSGLGGGSGKTETGNGGEKKPSREIKWSWVGNRSPLMGNKEEAEWVLERLTRTLNRELEQIRREELESEKFEDQGEEEGANGDGDSDGEGGDKDEIRSENENGNQNGNENNNRNGDGKGKGGGGGEQMTSGRVKVGVGEGESSDATAKKKP